MIMTYRGIGGNSMLSKILKIDKAIQIDELVKDIEAIGRSVEVKVETVGQMTSMLIEKYFIRNSNVGCCSVSIYSHSPINHDVIVMSGGSYQGAFFKLSSGADERFIKDVCSVFKKAGGVIL